MEVGTGQAAITATGASVSDLQALVTASAIPIAAIAVADMQPAIFMVGTIRRGITAARIRPVITVPRIRRATTTTTIRVTARCTTTVIHRTHGIGQ